MSSKPARIDISFTASVSLACPFTDGGERGREEDRGGVRRMEEIQRRVR
jgi:hypothetical protein